MAGVSMYVNDCDLKGFYDYLFDVLNENSTIYIKESVGVEKRLTLNKHFSESLKCNYSVIYRTREEYLALMKGLTDKTIILKEKYCKELDRSVFSDTSHWCIVLKKPATSSK